MIPEHRRKRKHQFTRNAAKTVDAFEPASDAREKGNITGKKKMRSLGTVQVPTEAFLAVLKLDE